MKCAHYLTAFDRFRLRAQPQRLAEHPHEAKELVKTKAQDLKQPR
ncbi:MAG TPA: hypothetical protein VN999_17315 [Thermoanaerobaculia bacterium]|nr:hypothetical protein [Thermoanaerobaculia bacterium]